MTDPPEPQQGQNTPFELEELVEPLQPSELAPLVPGSTLESPEGTLTIGAFLGCHGLVNTYEAEFQQERVLVRETQDPACAARLRREFEVLASVRHPMVPRAFSCFEHAERTYLVTEPVVGPTMADVLASSEGAQSALLQMLPVLAQVAFATSQLHAQGWAHLALRPGSIVLGKPIRLTDFGYAVRQGEKLAEPFFFAGYSAPELLAGGPIDARADVYSIGALLFHAVAGCAVPESGAVLTGWQPPVPLPGLPQVLHKCLGPIESRYANAVELHRELLRLVRRFAPQVRYHTAALSSIGLEPTRTTNQDAWGLLCCQSENEEAFSSWAVAVVADGMGGMAAGELASTAAVSTVLGEAAAALAVAPQLDAERQAQMAAELVRRANEKVCDILEAKHVKGGCTLACAVVVDRRLAIGHVGDCRIYLLRAGQVSALTRDHSLAMALVMQGQLDPSQLRTCPERSNVTRSLGDRRKLPDYYVDTLATTTGSTVMDLQPGDVLVLCSDGLWEIVYEETMVNVLAAAGADLNAAANKLVQLALEGGGPDNATVVLLRIDEVSPTQTKV